MGRGRERRWGGSEGCPPLTPEGSPGETEGMRQPRNSPPPPQQSWCDRQAESWEGGLGLHGAMAPYNQGVQFSSGHIETPPPAPASHPARCTGQRDSCPRIPSLANTGWYCCEPVGCAGRRRRSRRGSLLEMVVPLLLLSLAQSPPGMAHQPPRPGGPRPCLCPSAAQAAGR